MSAKTPISLVNFFVFNPSFGPNEGQEHEKVLYYYPKGTDLDTQIRNVGLCEAVIKFAKTFEPAKQCEAVHTQKTRQLFLEVEPEFWMIVTVSIPFVQKAKHAEYHNDDVHDNVFAAVLKQTYQMFKLFMGTFAHNMKNSNTVKHLRLKLEHFFSRYLLTLRLQDCDIMDIFQGIYFLPLDKNNFLKIQFYVNQLESLFQSVKYVAFLFNDQLVWSGLAQDDMQIMYKYLTTSLFPAYQESELQIGSVSPSASSQSSGVSHFGKFVTGPSNLNESNNAGKIPRVFIQTENAVEEFHLIVYRALGASVCLLIDITTSLTMEFFKKLDSFLGPQLTSLASEIGDHYSRSSTSSSAEFKFIYFNQMNLAQKSTVHCDSRRTRTASVPSEIMSLVSDLNADLKRLNKNGEIILKTMGDCWVVGKYSDQREFYVINHQKNANLIEINEEVKKLCSTHFNNIFILD